MTSRDISLISQVFRRRLRRDAWKFLFRRNILRRYTALPPLKRHHIISVNRGKRAAEKRYFRGFPCYTAVFGNITSRCHILRCQRLYTARYCFLIAEAALMRAARMRHKKSHVYVFQIPISSNASFAAACSAFFLLLPTPAPITLLFKCTSTLKCLSWSGPLSLTRTYFKLSP